MIEIARIGLSAMGIGLLGYGCWLSYPPAGFIVTGVILFGLGLIGALRAS